VDAREHLDQILEELLVCLICRKAWIAGKWEVEIC
jgi:hypothetical protein